MEKLEVDFLSKNDEPTLPSRPKRNLKKIIASIIIITIVILAVFSSSIVFSNEDLAKGLSKFNLIGQLGRLIGAGDKQLIGEDNDRINILLIGMGGKSHEGGTLADTIILGSYKPSTKQVAMMSIPRDLYIATEKYGKVKVNAVNAYAERDNPGSGGETLAKALSDLLGEEIKYYVTVDFDGFEKVIDEFGGVDIDVERNLIDYEYPIRGKENVFPIENRYETLYIEKGLQHMDGETALKYARSRHAIGIEGSDFARSRRQQKILAALKDKIFDVKTFFSPRKINSLLNAYQDHIITDLEVGEMVRLAQIGKDIDTTKIINQTLSDAADNFLYSSMINGAYVLLPKGGSYDTIAKLWQNIFYIDGDSPLATNIQTTNPENDQDDIKPIKNDEKATSSEEQLVTAPEPATADYKTEKATIEIQNGTWVTGWAGQERTKLENLGLKVLKATNAINHDFKATIIYDLSDGAYLATAAELEKIYGSKINSTAPTNISSTADFLIILGK